MTATGTGSSDPVGDQAHVIAAAVLALPGVAQLHAGLFSEVATYLPGERVTGVRLRDTSCEVHVVVVSGPPVLAVADRIRSTVAAITGWPVDVTIEDVVPPSPVADPQVLASRPLA